MQVRLELARAYVTLRDRNAAHALVDEARAILALRPALGVLAEQVAALETEVGAMPEAAGGGTWATRAELRLLPLLSTHLPRDRRAPVRLAKHDQDAGDLRLPQVGVSSRSDEIARAARSSALSTREPAAPP